ncbi:hypothetical protein JOB18_040536 [Solea senegalensis]|uniref:Uncharacterized protein n=1 Tax=Solea senegalensis TaxID=28829 RepID=A0AAV6S6J0_SOLSE|nr:hypothetical protein JOB18_040536 [Solea senegalensis]
MSFKLLFKKVEWNQFTNQRENHSLSIQTTPRRNCVQVFRRRLRQDSDLQFHCLSKVKPSDNSGADRLARNKESARVFSFVCTLPSSFLPPATIMFGMRDESEEGKVTSIGLHHHR